MGNDGRKMSKNYGNYPDPKNSLIKYGADSLRLYLMGSPITIGQDIAISEDEWLNQKKTVINIFWNSYKFFINNAALDNFKSSDTVKEPDELTILDQWIIARLKQASSTIEKELENYNIPKAVAEIYPLINDLSTWYIRRSRNRVGSSATNQKDKNCTYQTMAYTFTKLLQIIAPFAPFLSEKLYLHLTGNESVHLTDWPKLEPLSVKEKQLIKNMVTVRKICEAGHAQRKQEEIPVRQALAKITVSGLPKLDQDLLELIRDELNIEEVIFDKDKEFAVSLDTKLTPQLIAKGQVRQIIRTIQQERKEQSCRLDQKINLTLPDWPKQFESEIKQKTLTQSISKGQKLSIEKL